MDRTPRRPGPVPMERSSRNSTDQSLLETGYEPDFLVSSLTTPWFNDGSWINWNALYCAPAAANSYSFATGTVESSSPNPWASAWPSDQDTLSATFYDLTSHSPSYMDDGESSPFSASHTDAPSLWSLDGLGGPARDEISADLVGIGSSLPSPDRRLAARRGSDELVLASDFLYPHRGLTARRASEELVPVPVPDFDFPHRELAARRVSGDLLRVPDFVFPTQQTPSAASQLSSLWWPDCFSGPGSSRGESSRSRQQREDAREGGEEDRMDLDDGIPAQQGLAPDPENFSPDRRPLFHIAVPSIHVTVPTRVSPPTVTDTLRTHEWYNCQPTPNGLYYCPVEGCPDRAGINLRCNYQRHIDSHVKPFRCEVAGCDSPTFSSQGCLFRHTRESHGRYNAETFRCTIEGCEREQRPFRRRWNRTEHLKRVHNIGIGETTPPPSVPDQPARDRIQSQPELTSEPRSARRPRRRRFSEMQSPHSNETPTRIFMCPMPDCNVTFRRESNVENHLINVHQIDGPHPSPSIRPPSPPRPQARSYSPFEQRRAEQATHASTISRRSAMRVAELERQLLSVRPIPSATTVTTPPKPEAPKASRKSVHADTECPICCELLWNGEDERLSWCKAQCGQNFHASCWEIWEKEQKRRTKRAKCAMCRSEWVG